jgi:hypothetical protein
VVPPDLGAPLPCPPALTSLGVPPPYLPAAPGLTVPAESDGATRTLKESVAARVSALGKTADRTHDRLERGMLYQVIRLDDFFGRPNSQKELHTAYLLRWRNSLRLEQGGALNFGSALRANLELSKINDRLQLSFAGEDKPDPFAPSLPEDPGNPGFDRTFRTARIVNTELRYQVIRSPVNDLFLGAGVDLALPPRAFARARFQRLQKLDELSLVRFAETLFAKTPFGVGETTELSLERLLNPKTVLRLANSGTVSQEIAGLEWGSELSLLHELSPRSAITLTGGAYGNTSFASWVNNYRLLLRYRRNILRSWLFCELEPQQDWQRTADGKFSSTHAFTVRFEVVFQGQERRAADLP